MNGDEVSELGAIEVPVGVPFPPFAFELVRQAVPPHLAREVLLFGTRYSVEHAAAVGIVAQLAEPREALLEVALAQVAVLLLSCCLVCLVCLACLSCRPSRRRRRAGSRRCSTRRRWARSRPSSSSCRRRRCATLPSTTRAACNTPWTSSTAQRRSRSRARARACVRRRANASRRAVVSTFAERRRAHRLAKDRVNAAAAAGGGDGGASLQSHVFTKAKVRDGRSIAGAGAVALFGRL